MIVVDPVPVPVDDLGCVTMKGPGCCGRLNGAEFGIASYVACELIKARYPSFPHPTSLEHFAHGFSIGG